MYEEQFYEEQLEYDQSEQNVLKNLQDAMLRHSGIVAFANSLYHDQLDVNEAKESLEQQESELSISAGVDLDMTE